MHGSIKYSGIIRELARITINKIDNISTACLRDGDVFLSASAQITQDNDIQPNLNKI